MDGIVVLAAGVVMLLSAYLIVALLFPERFS